MTELLEVLREHRAVDWRTRRGRRLKATLAEIADPLAVHWWDLWKALCAAS